MLTSYKAEFDNTDVNLGKIITTRNETLQTSRNIPEFDTNNSKTRGRNSNFRRITILSINTAIIFVFQTCGLQLNLDFQFGSMYVYRTQNNLFVEKMNDAQLNVSKGLICSILNLLYMIPYLTS